MKAKNELSYTDMEMILMALEQMENHEAEFADHLWHSGEQEITGPHYDYANECHKLIIKLRAFQF